MTQYDLGLVIGSDGKGITSITKTSSSGLEDTYTITYTDESTTTFTVTNGAKGDTGATGATGATGKGITSITKTGTSGKVDTYTITYSDNSTSTFTVTNGNDGVGIQSIEKTGSVGLVDNYRIHFTDSTYYDYQVTNGKDGTDGTDGTDGQDGSNGRGISSISKTGTSGLVDTYTITYDDSSTPTTYTVTNGADGVVPIVTSWESTLSDTKVASEKLTKNSLDDKISKSNTAGLVKNDGTIDTTSYISSLPSASTSTSGIVQLVDNLTTNDDSKALTAKQGKALNDLIGSAIAYINL